MTNATPVTVTINSVKVSKFGPGFYQYHGYNIIKSRRIKGWEIMEIASGDCVEQERTLQDAVEAVGCILFRKEKEAKKQTLKSNKEKTMSSTNHQVVESTLRNAGFQLFTSCNRQDQADTTCKRLEHHGVTAMTILDQTGDGSKEYQVWGTWGANINPRIAYKANTPIEFCNCGIKAGEKFVVQELQDGSITASCKNSNGDWTLKSYLTVNQLMNCVVNATMIPLLDAE